MKFFLILILLVTMNHANPIAISPLNSPIEFFALFSESIIIALLLRHHGFYPFRTFLLWMMITIITYLFFIWFFLPLLVNFFGFSSFIFFAIVVELLIVFTEAKIIQKLSSFKVLNKEQRGISSKDAYIVSFIGNIVSILMGFVHFWS